ncbi:oligosaccharide flippase family protein [Vibrio fluvialis]|uniref:oligosaccharide flippase family protein n=1 Tax=Vibrio fluvialis TaxID=676 RepID=UPI0014045EC8|nr:oligosaccharide flippase family protein [Vibrio fluvialis]NHN72895.1 oligosaccharide flippase family protein [Vibrio fluvialis]
MLTKLIKYFPSKVLPGIFSVLLVQLLSNELTPNDYGVLSLAVSVCMLISILSGDWISQILNRYYTDGIELVCLSLVLVAWILCSLALICISHFFNIDLDLILISLVSLSLVFFNVLLDVVRLSGNILYFNIFTSLRSGTYFFFILMLSFYSEFRYQEVLYCWLLSNGLFVIYIFKVVFSKDKLVKKKFNFYTIIGYLKFGAPLILNSAVMFIISSSDRFLLNYYGLDAGLGIYSLNYDLIFKTLGALSILSWYVLYPKLVEKTQSSNNYIVNSLCTEFKKSYLKISLLSYVIILPLLLIYYCNFIDSRYIDLEIFIILVASIFLWDMKNLCFDSVNKIFNKTRQLTFVSIIVCLVNAIINITFMPDYGYLVAAYSSFLSYMVGAIMSLSISRLAARK